MEQYSGYTFLTELLDGYLLTNIEMSIKITQKMVLPNRYLTGIESRHIDWNNLRTILNSISFPQEHLNTFEHHFIESSSVLFGFEEDDGKILYKCYLEFWDKISKNVLNGNFSKKPVLMHLGVKWDPNDSQRCFVTNYYCRPLLNIHGIRKRLNTQFGITNQVTIAASKILDLAYQKVNDPGFVYLEAQEKNNLRNSFDINIYKASLKIIDIAKCLENYLETNNLLFLEVFQGYDYNILGHISGGINRDNSDFLTLYFELN